MTFTLFPDQAELMDELRGAMRKSKRVLLQAATGSGKTALATNMIMGSASKRKRAIFGVPRVNLMEQTSNTFREHGIPHSFIASGKPYDPFASLYIGMTETMANRVEANAMPSGIKLFIPDETHFGADALGTVIDYLQKQGAYTVGLSATPWKLNGQGLGIWYDTMIQGKSIRWLIENGRLSPYRFFHGKKRGDFSNIREKTDKEISSIMEQKREIIGDCVSSYIEHGLGKLWIVRCTSIKHSQETAAAFQAAGITAAHVDGKTPDDQLKAIIMAYARREIMVLTFADLLNFGFDLAQASGMDVCIEGGSDLKPSKSLAGQLQFWGRLLRWKLFPAIIIDHVNNFLEHGLPCSDRVWTLDSKKKRDGGEKTPATRQCKVCWAVFSPLPICPSCGAPVEVDSREIKQVDGTLEEIDLNIQIVKKKQEQGQAETLEDLIALGVSRGHQYPVRWAKHVFASRQAKKAKEKA